MDQHARLEALEAENERLRERVVQLEETLGMSVEMPIFLGLTQHEAQIFGVLIRRDAATKPQLMSAMYGHRPDGDEPEMKIVDVFVCKIRKKLAPYGISIETLWGQGYRLAPLMKERALALIQERAA